MWDFTSIHLPQITRQQHSTLRSCGRVEDDDDDDEDDWVWEYGGVAARLPVQVLQYSMASLLSKKMCKMSGIYRREEQEGKQVRKTL